MTGMSTRPSKRDRIPAEETVEGECFSKTRRVTGPLGFVVLARAAWLDSWLGVIAWVLAALGVGMIGYAFDLVFWARRGAMLAVASNAVALTGPVALSAFKSVLSNNGEIAVGIVAAVIALFVVAQPHGIAKLRETY